MKIYHLNLVKKKKLNQNKKQIVSLFYEKVMLKEKSL